MRKILILGAGRSSSALIHYLHEHAGEYGWEITIGEKNYQMLREKLNEYSGLNLISFDIEDENQVRTEIEKTDVVISMLPARFHLLAAKHCAELGRHFLTASYSTPEIRNLHYDFERQGKLCLMEMGLDPGIDHMSAMQVLDRIKNSGYELTGFETFTGGLVSEEQQEENPWRYKFTWNPRNVVLAGQGYVKFIQQGRYKYIPYQRLFKRTEVIHLPGYGYFEGYPNRDSLKYMDLYGLRGIPTLFRGTLRRPGFCKSWDALVQLGATDDSYQLEKVDELTHRQFINTFLPYNPTDSVELKLCYYLGIGLESEEMHKLKWLDLFEEEPVGLKEGTPAQILEHILMKKWKLAPQEKDMIVMWHKFDFSENGKPRQIQSQMVVEGTDDEDTAMSKTVGLPLAMAAKLILSGQIELAGVHIPTVHQIYDPVLKELGDIGFAFAEHEVER